MKEGRNEGMNEGEKEGMKEGRNEGGREGETRDEFVDAVRSVLTQRSAFHPKTQFDTVNKTQGGHDCSYDRRHTPERPEYQVEYHPNKAM